MGMPIPRTKSGGFVPSLSLGIALILGAWVAFNVLRSPPTNPISWDAFGYYLYLPAAFLHDDIWLQDTRWVNEAVEQYGSTETIYQYGPAPNGRLVFKYTMGLAVLWMPFFALGHLAAWLTGSPMDGFSEPYQWALILGALVFVQVGLLLLRRSLLHFFSDVLVAVLLVMVTLGTNFWHQAVFGSTMPHVFLFTLHAAALLYTIKWSETGKSSHLFISALCVGLAGLTRPTDVLGALFPVFLTIGQQKSARSSRAHWRPWFCYFALLLVIVSPQLIYWKGQTGQFLYDSYNNPGEGFEFLHPYVFEFLFSGRKGWLLYSPLLAIALLGIPLMTGSLRPYRWPILVVMVCSVYVLGSWSCWWYAESFGQRSMVQFYPYLMLPLGAMLTTIAQWRRAYRWSMYSLMSGLVVLNMFQIQASLSGIIHTSRMTWTAYKAVFGRTTKPVGFEQMLLVDRSTPMEKGPSRPERYIRIMVQVLMPDSMAERARLVDSVRFSGSRALRLSADARFSPGQRFKWRSVGTNDHVWFKLTCRVLRPSEGGVPQVTVVTSFQHEGRDYAYRTTDIDLSGTKLGTWHETEVWYLSPEVRTPEDEFICYYWAFDGDTAFVAPMTVEVFAPRRTVP